MKGYIKMDHLAEFKAKDLRPGDVVFTLTRDIIAGSGRIGASKKLGVGDIRSLKRSKTITIDNHKYDIEQLFMDKKRVRMRVLLGAFPVWLTPHDQDGKEINKITGFWANIASNVDIMLFYFLHYLTLGVYDRDMFAFFPYKENNCKWWYQAIICSLTNKRW